jgi:GT2 family glycosyltransferase
MEHGLTPITRITIGITTYGSLPRVNGCLKSLLYGNLSDHHTPTIIVVDDGTQDMHALREREEFCRSNKVTLIKHGENRGIAAGWNTIARHDPNAELVVILNDDTRFTSPDWLPILVSFFDKNDKIGTVGLPLVQDMEYRDTDERWLAEPGIVGAAVGCSFAVRPDVLFQVENPDGINGFWEDTLSFHEEVHAGFRMAQLGYLSYMLPWPPLCHYGGSTFQSSPELTWRTPSSYVSMDEFLQYVRALPFYLSEYEEQYAQGQVDRMSYSRCMFAKYWGILDMERHQEIKGENVDIWAEPQKWVHHHVIDPMVADGEPKVTWVNKDGKLQSKE